MYRNPRIRMLCIFAFVLVSCRNSIAQTSSGTLAKTGERNSYSTHRSQEVGAHNDIPQLTHAGDRTQLLVDGSPFIILGGQALNSSASNLADIENVYKSLDAMHANTAEIPVSWNLLERQPGQFDFHLVDGAIERARAHHFHLVFLWFGTTKNATLSYVPDWIKKDRAKYFRARNLQGKEMEAISPFCIAALKADQHAFSALMRHIREFDGKQHTVILVKS